MSLPSITACKSSFLMETVPDSGRKPEFSIPLVDLDAYLHGNGDYFHEVDSVVDQIRSACATSGFFQIVGHGISQMMQDSVLRASKALFSLPQEEKSKLKGKPGVGYETFGSQVLEAGKKPDLKEVS